MNQRSIIPIASMVVAALLSACAAAPQRIEQLEQARAQVQTLAQDPLVSEAASRELQSAQESLARAENALKEDAPREEVVHLAYVAQRYAQIGQERIEENRARQQIAQGEAERNRVLLEARAREAETATRRAESARAETQAAQAQLQSLQQELSELQAQKTQRGMVLTLGDVLFDTDKATLKRGADLALNRLSEFLREHPDTRIIIEGHTDSRGSEQYNEALSRRRAQAVADALIVRGIGSDRFEILGRGEGYPVASNTSVAGRQQNRRVEIVFSDAAGRFAEGARESALR